MTSEQNINCHVVLIPFVSEQKEIIYSMVIITGASGL